MGLWNWMNRIGVKNYHAAKSAVGGVYEGARAAVHTIGQVSDTIDNLLAVAQQYPIARELASVVRDNEIYKEIRRDIKLGEDLIDDVGTVGTIVGGIIEKGLGIDDDDAKQRVSIQPVLRTPVRPASQAFQPQLFRNVGGRMPRASPSITQQAPGQPVSRTISTR